MALLAVAATFTACSEDGYWDAAPAGDSATYSFLQKKMSYSLQSTDVLTEVQVPIIRSNAAGEQTIDVQATFNSPALSSEQTSVTFANGSNKGVFTVNVGELEIGVNYAAKLVFSGSIMSADGDSAITVSIKKDYSWVKKGVVLMSSEWEGVNDVPVVLEEALGYKDDAGNHYMRLLSPYYFIAPDYCSKEGLHAYFYLDKDYNASIELLLPFGVQVLEDDDVAWYISENYLQYLDFANDNNTYYVQTVWLYGGSLKGPCVESWVWPKEQYDAAKADPNWVME